MESYVKVTKSESNAYKAMKVELDMTTDDQLLNYIKVKTVNNFNPSHMYLATMTKTSNKQGGGGNRRWYFETFPTSFRIDLINFNS